MPSLTTSAAASAISTSTAPAIGARETHGYAFVIVCWTIGACFGIVGTTFAAFLRKKGFEVIDCRRMSMGALFAMVIIDLVYFILKIHQLSGTGDCGVLEALSVLTYLGSHVAQYCFYIFRYIEVYGRRWPFIVPAILLVIVFITSIPVSIFSNITTHENGVCLVNHPTISAVMPAATDFVLVVYLIVLFVEPLFRSSLMLRPFGAPETRSKNQPPPPVVGDMEEGVKPKSGFTRIRLNWKTPSSTPKSRRLSVSNIPGIRPAWKALLKRRGSKPPGTRANPTASFSHPTGAARQRRMRRRLAITLLVTSLIGLSTTAFFNATLSTPIGEWAPVMSSLDLAVNYVFSVLPYFLIAGRDDGGAGERNAVKRKKEEISEEDGSDDRVNEEEISSRPLAPEFDGVSGDGQLSNDTRPVDETVDDVVVVDIMRTGRNGSPEEGWIKSA
ncbi:hypothetical protein BC829DRAFT_390802 [Chytridium lagenaria]|nr:hypothetical protein BC829DRAFT_390802 [Chytridium lagenaria]